VFKPKLVVIETRVFPRVYKTGIFMTRALAFPLVSYPRFSL